jgi:pyruvate dehydrogenase (quinone)
MGSQWLPDMPYAEYAKLLGLRGIYCDKTKDVGKAWDEALSANEPVVLEFKVDQEVPPLPPHIMKSQAKSAVKAWIKDPERSGLAVHGFRQKLAEFYEALPGKS